MSVFGAELTERLGIPQTETRYHAGTIGRRNGTANELAIATVNTQCLNAADRFLMRIETRRAISRMMDTLSAVSSRALIVSLPS
jgi:hypothetical protein